VTSPPYFGLRDYGVTGQIGLENTPDAYIARLMDVFTEVYRVLKPEGTFWLNIGDSYAGSGKSSGHDNSTNRVNYACNVHTTSYKGGHIKAKDLIGIPWLLAFALRNAGWYLRQEIIWHKTDPMPESVRDRCTKSHESLFLLTKSSKYYFDSEAIMEPVKYDGRKATAHKGSVKYQGNAAGIPTQTLSKGGRERWPNTIRGYAGKDNLTGLSSQHHGNNIITCPARNKRDVWIVPTRPFKGAHFATFPPDLIKPCILSGCPVGGIVLDPFFGAVTTGLVAKQLNRNFLGIELNPEYIKIAEERLQLNRI
jgi:DNA modification methylase